ncbi:MAG: SDR family oxidoreductase [Pseudomonadales bacterium]|nr:SDR family oxidoreductase [Pseudomonadales bacterium]MCP5182308.1 SDR family oxidoreductase [Pseudomonadales bacterium]
MKSMLVTGAARGLGADIARLASARGYRVGMVDRDAEELHALAAEVPNSTALAADVTDEAAVEGCLERFGTVDVLVNNAGILRTGPLIDHSLDDFRLVLDVNLVSLFIVGRAVARRMRAQGGGAIVNMSSVNGIHPSLNAGAYVAAKAGVIGLTQQMAIEWGEFGIRVNAVAPGFIDAGMSSPFYAAKAVRERRGNAVPVRRLGSARDVAESVLFLVSEAAAYVSGQTLAVDGGLINSVLAQLPRE